MAYINGEVHVFRHSATLVDIDIRMPRRVCQVGRRVCLLVFYCDVLHALSDERRGIDLVGRLREHRRLRPRGVGLTRLGDLVSASGIGAPRRLARAIRDAGRIRG